MSDSLEKLKERAGIVFGEYDAWFAGHPRVTRDAARLARMTNDLKALASQAGRQGAEGQAFAQELAKTIELYTQEQAAITTARERGPSAFEAQRAHAWAQVVFGRYQRHFAGRNRATRDLGLLAELIDHLRRIEKDVKRLAEEDGVDVAATLDSVQSSLQLYLGERGEIVDARGRGTSEEQADILAECANEQFALYKAHFAGKSRLSRHPMLLQRVLDTLAVVKDRMETLRDQGLQSAQNDRNIGIIDERVGFYRKEIEAIRARRGETSFEELVGALGGAANELFEGYRKEYAGQSRDTRELQPLSDILDGLVHVALQMDDLDRVRDNETNTRNLQIVLDHIRLYQREYDLIRQARGQG